jgi:hypothetical protein
MDASVTVSIISGVGVILSAWFAFAGNRKGTLATAEQSFRTTILEENEKLRKRVEELETKLSKVVVENQELQLEMVRLKTQSPVPSPPDNVVSIDGGNAG